MDDRWAVALAGAVALGALRPSGVPLVLAVGLGLLGVARRRPLLVCLAAGLLASALAQRSLDGLDGLRPGVVHGVVTLLTDPERLGDRVEAEVRLDGRHLLLQARGPAADDLAPRLAGERLLVRGRIQPIDAPDAWTRSRHLAGRLRASTVDRGPPATWPSAAANVVRRALTRGAAVLGERRAALFSGLVVGDDRDQPPDLADDFEGAGLVHLLAVSGQNVAFVLAVAAPLLRRLRLWPRLVLTIAVIAAFALATRFEPSVTRAAAMAGLAAATTTIGRPVSRLRVLSLGVAALLLVDPLLVGSLGFRLSVAAVAAIAVGAEPIAAALPGPRWLAEPIGVTVAAQLGVAPLLLGAFGPLPVASLPANVLAVPVAGLVMAWGTVAGPLAGWWVPAAPLLHAPTRLLLWWVEAVAARCARAPLGSLGATGVAAVGAGLALVVAAARSGAWAARDGQLVPRTSVDGGLGASVAAGGQRVPRTSVDGGLGASVAAGGQLVPRTWARVARGVGWSLVAGALFVAVVSVQAPPRLRTSLGSGVVRWHTGSTDVLVLGGGSWQRPLGSEAVLSALRTAGVGALDLVVAVDDEVPPGVVAAVLAAHPAGAVLVPASMPPTDRPTGAVPLPAAGTALEVGDLHVLVSPAGDRLVVEAWPARPGR